MFGGHDGQYIYGEIVELAQSYGYSPSAEVECAVCGEPIVRVVETHATYWESAEDGDSLSYSPTLHDHAPAAY